MAEQADEILRLMIRLEQMARSADGDLAKQLKRMEKELINSMGMLGRIDSRKKMKEIRAALKKIAKQRYKAIEDRIGDYSETAAEAAIRVEEAGFTALGADASDAVSNIATEKVIQDSLERNLPGLPEGRQITVGQMLDRFTSNGAVYASNIANKALIEGLSMDQAARELRKVVDISNRDARSMVRTAIMGAANEARDKVAESFNYQHEMWLSTLDSRTCPFCSGRDGVCDEPGQLPRPPAHPNCRCTILYIPKGTSCAEMKEQMQRPQRGPDGKSTRNTPYKDYGEWLKTQPEDFQIEILGKERYELLKSGKISFKQMYLRNGSRKSIEQIRTQYGIKKPITKAAKKKNVATAKRLKKEAAARPAHLKDTPAVGYREATTWQEANQVAAELGMTAEYKTFDLLMANGANRAYARIQEAFPFMRNQQMHIGHHNAAVENWAKTRAAREVAEMNDIQLRAAAIGHLDDAKAFGGNSYERWKQGHNSYKKWPKNNPGYFAALEAQETYGSITGWSKETLEKVVYNSKVQKGTRGFTESRNAWGYTWGIKQTEKEGLVVITTKAKKVPGFEVKYRNSCTSKFHPPGTADFWESAVATHEFGHNVDYVLSQSPVVGREWNDFIALIRQEVQASSEKTFTNRVSIYADKNARELVAEAITDVLDDHGGSEMSNRIVNKIKELEEKL